VHFLTVLVFLLTTPLVWAQEPSVRGNAPQSFAQLPAQCPTTERWQNLSLEELNSLVLACDEVALFHAKRGAMLLVSGKIEEAAVALEKALLLEPNLPGAQLDYAHALALIGQRGSARAMLAQVLERADIEPALKGQLQKAQPQSAQQQNPQPQNSQQQHPQLQNAQPLIATAPQSRELQALDQTQARTQAQTLASLGAWEWSAVAQTALGRESNLNSATYTEALTLMLSNGPVTIGLSDTAKPVSGNALKSSLLVQGVTRAGFGGIELGELSLVASGSHRYALGSAGQSLGLVENNSAAEALIKYSLPVHGGQGGQGGQGGIAGQGVHGGLYGLASGQLQLSVGGTQFWLGSSSAYADSGAHLKFVWDTLGQACKLAPSAGLSRQIFPNATSLNGVYSYARMELGCKEATSESQFALGSGIDKAFSSARPGGDKHRTEFLVKHERIVSAGPLPQAQISAWARYVKSQDTQIFSELLGGLKTSSKRADLGLGFWVPIQKSWSAGVNLEATSQKSNNALFNLRNSSFYVGLRWSDQ
jgi:tetratricopeptide (TPR) repeat protein